MYIFTPPRALVSTLALHPTCWFPVVLPSRRAWLFIERPLICSYHSNFLVFARRLLLNQTHCHLLASNAQFFDNNCKR